MTFDTFSSKCTTMKTRLTILTLFALLLFATSTHMTYAEIEDGNDLPGVYDTIRDAAESRRDELLYLLDEDISSEVMENLQTALQQMQQAESTQDPQASLSYYMKALQSFRKTWSSYLDANEETSLNTLEQVPEADIPEPETGEDLDAEIKENKARLLDRFQERIEEEYSSLYGEIEEMMELLPEEDSEKVLKTFEKAQEKLNRIKEKLENGDVDDAINTLDDDLGTFEDDLEYLNDKNASKTLRKIEKMDHEAHKIKIEKETKEKKGEDTSEEDEQIKDLKEDIKEAKEEYKSNNGKSNEDKDNPSDERSNRRDKDKTK